MVPLELIGATGTIEEKFEEKEREEIGDEEEAYFHNDFKGIAWRNVNKTVRARDNQSVIQLVHQSTGVVRAGELMAVMGLSGCGKTTLLRILAGRDHNDISGDLIVGYNEIDLCGNSNQIRSKTRRQIGYVAQEDIFLDTLTLKEHLSFNAQLRQSESSRNTRRYQDTVQQVIDDLHLERCENNLIRWLSGGEKKRCSIATELLADPTVLILDEATSGLDSAVAAALLYNLKSLASGYRYKDKPTDTTNQHTTNTYFNYYQQQHQKKLAIIMSIHQPSTGLFYSFDKLLLMVEGRMIYYGSIHAALQYFNHIGFELPATSNDDSNEQSTTDTSTLGKGTRAKNNKSTLAYNPADFMIELLYSVYPMPDTNTHIGGTEVPFAKQREYIGWLPRYILVAAFDKQIPEHDVEDFLHSQAATMKYSINTQTRLFNKQYKQRPFCVELWILLHRTFLATSRTKALSTIGFLEIVFIACLAGITWFQTKLLESTIMKFSGFLFFNTAYWFFVGLFSGLLEFYPERFVVVKDYYAGAYRLSTYYLSRAIGSIPVRLIFPTIFTIIANLLALDPSVYNNENGVSIFLLTIVLLSLTVITGEAVGTFIGLLTTDLDRSISIGNITALSMLIFGGFYIKDIPFFISWLKYVSVLKYCFDVLCQIRLPTNLHIPCNAYGYALIECFGREYITGEQAREILQVDEFSVGVNIVIMLALYIIFRIAGYLALVMRVQK